VATPVGATPGPDPDDRGIPVRREFEYRRNGTAVLFAGLNVHEGDLAAWVTDSSRGDNFVEILGDLVVQTPAGMELHCIVDNLPAHFTDKVESFLDEHPMFSCTTPNPCLLAQPGRVVLLDSSAAAVASR